MYSKIVLSILCLSLSTHTSRALWSCSTNQDCSSLEGGVCSDGDCVCPLGTQETLRGTKCSEVAPYYNSKCVEDYQCSKLFTGYHCLVANGSQEGVCSCDIGYHYFHGRCWLSRGIGSACSRDEECQDVLRDPYSMICGNGVCGCADGYYTRQRGECRKIARGVGEGCVLDADCQFENGACRRPELVCYDITEPEPSPPDSEEEIQNQLEEEIQNEPEATDSELTDVKVTMTRQYGRACDVSNPCAEPFQCSSFGICTCASGYYSGEDGSVCYAELGAPATSASCVGAFAVLVDGVCTCPHNWYYAENMRDCTKPSQRLSDSCLSDIMCHTFGATSFCGDPAGIWGLRSCSCTSESIWDEGQQMCRLFAGAGELCEVSSDCQTGEVDVQCVADAQGVGRCTCPSGYFASEGLCVTSGLGVGDTCQLTQECDGTPNLACLNSICTCTDGFTQVNDRCAPMLGESCAANSDCAIANTRCDNATSTCQCDSDFVEFAQECWRSSTGLNAACTIDAQCVPTLGEGGRCNDGVCDCGSEYHYNGGSCEWKTGLFESCTRSTVCFLAERSDVVVCRNGLCQCDFQYPYSEELGTCVSSASTILSRSAVVLLVLSFVTKLIL